MSSSKEVDLSLKNEPKLTCEKLCRKKRFNTPKNTHKEYIILHPRYIIFQFQTFCIIQSVCRLYLSDDNPCLQAPLSQPLFRSNPSCSIISRNTHFALLPNNLYLYE